MLKPAELPEISQHFLASQKAELNGENLLLSFLFFDQFQVLGRLSTETAPLLVQGVTAATGFEMGWLFKLWQLE